MAEPQRLPSLIDRIIEAGHIELDVTPSIARELLGNMPRQRNASPSNISKYAQQMLNDKWYVGPPLALDSKGNVIEGQNRLRAVIKAGETRPDITVRFVIISGLDPDAIYAFDSGKKKNLGDYLTLRGEKHNTRELGGALVYLHKLRIGKMKSTGGQDRPTTDEAFALLDANPGIRELVQAGGRIEKKVKIPRALATMLYYAFGEKDAQEADIFFEYLQTGEAIEGPILKLRNKLLENAARPTDQKLSPVSIAAYVVQAWNNHMLGIDRQLRWRRGGSNPQPFPEILGPDDVE